MSKTWTAFVLMPFDKEFTALFDEVIKPTLKDAGYLVTRADSSLDQQNILSKIIKGITSTDLVIADLTTNNPNVFYELGICHGLNIPTVLLTQAIEEVPFDLRSYQMNAYSVRFDEIVNLKQVLREIVEKHKLSEVKFGNPVVDFGGLGKATTTDNKEVLIPLSPGSQLSVPNPKEEEAGFLDFMVEGTQAANEIKEFLNNLSDSTEAIAGRMQAHTQRIQQINENPGPGSSSQKYRIASETARDINVYSADIEEYLPDLEKSTKKFTEDFTNLMMWVKFQKAQEDQEEVDKLRASMQIFLQQIRRSLRSTSEYHKSILALKGISREVNSASRRLSHTLQRIHDVQLELEAFCTRTLAILNDEDESGDSTLV